MACSPKMRTAERLQRGPAVRAQTCVVRRWVVWRLFSADLVGRRSVLPIAGRTPPTFGPSGWLARGANERIVAAVLSGRDAGLATLIRVHASPKKNVMEPNNGGGETPTPLHAPDLGFLKQRKRNPHVLLDRPNKNPGSSFRP